MELRTWLERDDLTIDTLVSAASKLLPEVAPTQTRYKVTERPDVRTVRYYTSQKLLPKPDSYDGGRARYSGRHLIRLLLIKRMQAEHQTLSRIARVLDGASDNDVLRALGTDQPLKQKTSPPRSAGRARTTDRVRRLELAPGGALEVPREVIEDPARRAQLASNLEALADWLRSTDLEEE